MDNDTEEVPRYFTCPISLEIMKDPVTTPTGITYDRESIERWLFIDRRLTCPVTNEPLPSDAELTPNHTLRRLIQSWSTLHATNRIPTPRPPADFATVQNLLRNISRPCSLSLLSSLAAESESNRRLILRADGPRRLLSFLPSASTSSADSALSLFLSLRVPVDDLRPFISDNHELIHCLTTLISQSFSAILFLKTAFELASPKLLERLKVEAFQAVVGIIRDGISKQGTKAALQMLLLSCPWGTSRAKIVEAGAVAEIIEMELRGNAEKRMTELGLGVLEQLCMCADGRAALVGHAAGIAVVAQRMIKVSPAADEKAVVILTAVAKYSATSGEIVKEMMMVGAVSKLCLVMQAECLSGVKEKASWVLRLHSRGWKNSPCFNSDLLSR
ncbi:hypothetical protein IEQ34_018762 [Dendrobium chrysotoxum]|uniref:U-box domain-containing protein n=1 Tax=Dendrobium chrysotoxum TaxID=161865 RepID=A0AAV7G6P9_DENCH|nr:hypothetical protein IEQ34_018762 [Dendrobium chrysotoxum]